MSSLNSSVSALIIWMAAFGAVPASADRGPDQTPAADALPALPRLDLNGFLPAIQQQVQQAYDNARAHPENADANGTLGMVFDAYEQYDAALVCYDRARRLDPRSFRWLYLLGSVQAAQGRHQDAAQTFADALHLKPDDTPATLRRAESLLAIGQSQEAGAIYQLVAQAQPDRADAFYGLGRMAAARGDWAGAAAAYQKACDLFPSYGPAHYALATALRKLGRDAESQQQLALYEQNRTAVPPQADPLRGEVTMLNLGSVTHIRRGADLEQAGRIAEAIEEQLAALRVDPQSVQAHTNLISLYGRLGRYHEATQHYEAALALDPSQAGIHYNYGVLLLRQQDDVKAADAFRETLRLNPHYVEAHTNLGAIYGNRGHITEALQQFNAALADRPTDHVAHFQIGRMLAADERYDEAIEHLKQTLVPEDASTPRYLYALGATYARAGRSVGRTEIPADGQGASGGPPPGPTGRRHRSRPADVGTGRAEIDASPASCHPIARRRRHPHRRCGARAAPLP